MAGTTSLARREHADFGGYVHFQDADEQARIAENYAGSYSRLARIKAAYDSNNLFHVNHNIEPAVAAQEAVGAPTLEAGPTA